MMTPKVYDGKFDPMELKEWVRRMKKSFIVVEVPKDKKVIIGTYDLTGQSDFLWNIIKGKLVGPEFT